MHKNILSVAVLIASIALLIFSIGTSFAYPQGPNVSTGTNPIVSFNCNSTGYTIPSTSDYIITDFIGVSGNPYLYFDGTNSMYLNFAGNSTLMTGYRVSAGTVITYTSGSIHISGYLVHP
jgi:hypothetical protein